MDKCPTSLLAFFTAHTESITNSLEAAASILSQEMRLLDPSTPSALTACSLFRLSKRYTAYSLPFPERQRGRHRHYFLHVRQCVPNMDNPEEERQDRGQGAEVS